MLLLGRDVLWLPVRSLTVGRLVVPVRPWMPAVGLELAFGLTSVDEAVLPEEVLPDMLPVVGRVVVTLPLDEPPVRPLLETLAPLWLRGLSEGIR